MTQGCTGEPRTWQVPIKHGITPPDSPKSNVDSEAVWPAKLSCTYVGNIGTIAKRATNSCRLPAASQPFRPEK